MNFFEIVNPHLASLTDNERTLFDFVIKHMNAIKGMSIREVAAETFVSTATFIRFVKKIGFSGYSEFITVIKYTDLDQQQDVEPKPFVVNQKDYREEYLKNIQESVRVIRPETLHRITRKMSEHPDIFFFTKGISKHAAEYINYLYTMAGFKVHYPRDSDYRTMAMAQVNANSLVFIMTYDGNDGELLSMMNKFVEQPKKPLLVSVTEADNNMIQNLSDINLYIFTDDVKINNQDISSRISTIAIMELILYQWMEDYGE